MTKGREMRSQISVKVEGVCDHAGEEFARSCVTAIAFEGVDSLEARLLGEDLGDEEGSEGWNCEGCERVETILYSNQCSPFWWRLLVMLRR